MRRLENSVCSFSINICPGNYNKCFTSHKQTLPLLSFPSNEMGI